MKVVLKVERDQVREADEMAQAVRKGTSGSNDFLHICTSPWERINVGRKDMNFELLNLCCNCRAQRSPRSATIKLLLFVC